MTRTLHMTVPDGWRLVEPGDGIRSVDAAAADLTESMATGDRALWRSTVAEAWEHALSSVQQEHGEVVSLLVPVGGLAAELPVTVAVLRLALATSSPHEANSMLASVAAQDATARLLATDAGPAMRTHSRSALDSSHADRLAVQVEDLPGIEVLRARYLLPPLGHGRWLALLHTVVGVNDETTSAWLELCDALVIGARWSREE